MTRHHLMFCGLMVALMVIPFLPLEYSFASGERWPNHSGDIHPTPAITTAGGTIAGPICFDDSSDAFDGLCCYDGDETPTCNYRTANANSKNMYQNAEDVNPFAAAGATAGRFIIRGALDSKTVTCAVASCDPTDTVTVSRTVAGILTGTTLVFGTDFCVAGSCSTDALMAASLQAAIDALTGVAALRSSNIVGVVADAKTSRIKIVDSNAHAACTVISNGNDGAVESGGPLWVTYQNLSATDPDICIGTPVTCASGTGVGLYGSGGTLYISSGGSNNARLDVSSGWLMSGTYYYGWLSRTQLRGSVDGFLGIIKSDYSTGAGLSAAIGNRLSLTKADGTTLGEYAETMVGSATITLNNAAAQTIYTVPAGFTFLPSEVYVRNASTGTDATVAGGWGCDANCTNYRSGASFGSAITGSTSVARVSVQRDTEYKTCAAASVFCYKLTVASADADTVTMEVYGVLR